jgi:hypothetical protein
MSRRMPWPSGPRTWTGKRHSSVNGSNPISTSIGTSPGLIRCAVHPAAVLGELVGPGRVRRFALDQLDQAERDQPAQAWADAPVLGREDGFGLVFEVAAGGRALRDALAVPGNPVRGDRAE